jgi:cytochrome c oxidase subunit 2
MRLKRIILVATAGSLFLLGACGDDEAGSEDSGSGDSSASQSIELTASNFSYDKDSFEVEPRSEVEVTLTNEDDTEHTFSIEDPEVEVEAEGGESANGTFTAPEEGSVEFFCEYHPDQMRGEVTVGGTAAGDTGGGTDTSGSRGPYSD